MDSLPLIDVHRDRHTKLYTTYGTRICPHLPRVDSILFNSSQVHSKLRRASAYYSFSERRLLTIRCGPRCRSKVNGHLNSNGRQLTIRLRPVILGPLLRSSKDTASPRKTHLLFLLPLRSVVIWPAAPVLPFSLAQLFAVPRHSWHFSHSWRITQPFARFSLLTLLFFSHLLAFFSSSLINSCPKVCLIIEVVSISRQT